MTYMILIPTDKSTDLRYILDLPAGITARSRRPTIS